MAAGCWILFRRISSAGVSFHSEAFIYQPSNCNCLFLASRNSERLSWCGKICDDGKKWHLSVLQWHVESPQSACTHEEERTKLVPLGDASPTHSRIDFFFNFFLYREPKRYVIRSEIQQEFEYVRENLGSFN